MSDTKKRQVIIKLSPTEWDIVKTALFEYGQICDGEADLMDGSRSESPDELWKAMDKVRDKIGSQLRRSK